MRCKDAKVRIKKLERENKKLLDLAALPQKAAEMQRIKFNLLEIVIRSTRIPLYEYLYPGMVHIDMRVQGTDNFPAYAVKRVELAPMHLLLRNKKEFIKGMGEVMAAELLALGEKNIKS